MMCKFVISIILYLLSISYSVKSLKQSRVGMTV